MKTFEPIAGKILECTYADALMEIYRAGPLEWTIAKGLWESADVDRYYQHALAGRMPNDARVVFDIRGVTDSPLLARYQAAQHMRKQNERNVKTVVITGLKLQHFVLKTVVRLSSRKNVELATNEKDAYRLAMA